MSRITKQIASTFLLILSLCVSAASACGCAHHQIEPEPETTSCHGHSGKAEGAAGKGESRPTLSESDCICFRNAPRIAVKSESLKLKKIVGHAAQSLSQISQLKLLTNSSNVYISTSLHYSRAAYAFAPSRAPPIL